MENYGKGHIKLLRETVTNLQALMEMIGPQRYNQIVEEKHQHFDHSKIRKEEER